MTFHSTCRAFDTAHRQTGADTGAVTAAIYMQAVRRCTSQNHEVGCQAANQ